MASRRSKRSKRSRRSRSRRGIRISRSSRRIRRGRRNRSRRGILRSRSSSSRSRGSLLTSHSSAFPVPKCAVPNPVTRLEAPRSRSRCLQEHSGDFRRWIRGMVETVASSDVLTTEMGGKLPPLVLLHFTGPWGAAFTPDS